MPSRAVRQPNSFRLNSGLLALSMPPTLLKTIRPSLNDHALRVLPVDVISILRPIHCDRMHYTLAGPVVTLDSVTLPMAAVREWTKFSVSAQAILMPRRHPVTPRLDKALNLHASSSMMEKSGKRQTSSSRKERGEATD